jgi:hypothetical protein
MSGPSPHLHRYLSAEQAIREPLSHAHGSVRRHGHIQVKEFPRTWHDEMQLVLELLATHIATVIGYQCWCKVVRLHSPRPVFADKGEEAAVLAQDTVYAYRLQSDLVLVDGRQEGQYDQLDAVSSTIWRKGQV